MIYLWVLGPAFILGFIGAWPVTKTPGEFFIKHRQFFGIGAAVTTVWAITIMPLPEVTPDTSPGMLINILAAAAVIAGMNAGLFFAGALLATVIRKNVG